MPAAATAGASRATNGVPVPSVANTPAASTTALAMTQPSSSDGVVTSARARPGERSARAASRSTGPGLAAPDLRGHAQPDPVQIDVARAAAGQVRQAIRSPHLAARSSSASVPHRLRSTARMSCRTR